MNKQRRFRLIAVIAMLCALAAAAGLVLYALRQNINLFYTPTQVVKGDAPSKHLFRIGGMVVKGSVERNEKDLTVQFVLTDFKQKVTVRYRGILPDLFREGQGIVALGQLDQQKVFVANEVLAKHDENYVPPEVQYAIKVAKKIG